MNIELFEQSFSGLISSCRRTCCCGNEFYNRHNEDAFNEEEFERLQASDAIGVDHTVGVVVFEGNEFVADCDCWHKKAERIMGFINTHDVQIAEYLNNRRKLIIVNANMVAPIASV